jgi:crotonobetainyl-CoA:carnitine CoA-transferase CaiB-like acyl-CoA transferase
MTGPLASLKILDFTTLLPGPFATMFLADLGADVIKIEAPENPDGARFVPPFDGGLSTLHALVGRSKRTMALDLKKPGASEVIKRLVQTHDIVVEQFRPGVMDRLGVGYQALSEANQRLIYCSLTGYGQTGPHRNRPGHEINYMALSGIAYHIGRRGSGPVPLQVPVADLAGSSAVISGILAAEIHRRETGEGQFIDVSMFDGAASWNALAMAHYLAAGVEPEPESMALNGGTFYDYYRTRDGRYLSVASLEPKFWRAFCEAIELPGLVQPSLSSAPEEQSATKAEIQKSIEQRTLKEWLAILGQAETCVEPVLSAPEMVRHPQTEARALIVGVPQPDGSSQKQVGNPIKFSRCRAQYKHVGAEVGEHTEDVLQESGFSQTEITQLGKAGILGPAWAGR